MFMIRHTVTREFVILDQHGEPASLSRTTGNGSPMKEAMVHCWRFARLTHTCEVVEIPDYAVARRGHLVTVIDRDAV